MSGLITSQGSAEGAQGEAVRRHLLGSQGLWVDPHTADYLARRVGDGATPVQAVEFIAACARTGRCAFHALPALQVRSDTSRG